VQGLHKNQKGKTEIMQEITKEYLDDQVDQFEERAAVMQYEGGLSREHAEHETALSMGYVSADAFIWFVATKMVELGNVDDEE